MSMRPHTNLYRTSGDHLKVTFVACILCDGDTEPPGFNLIKTEVEDIKKRKYEEV